MSTGRFSFPSPPLPTAFTKFRQLGRDVNRDEDYIRERTAQSKYPAALLAELYAAGEINQEQYERLRRERT